MRSSISSLIIVCGLAAVSWTSSAKDIEPLAKLVCKTTKGTERQISHVHQIHELIYFFRGLTSEHKLFKCSKRYQASLNDLEQVVLQANYFACGEEKIELIENFHRDYISKVSKHVKRRKSAGLEAPKMVKLFFMQYVSKISSMCEQRAYAILERFDPQQPMSNDEMSFLNVLKRFANVFGMSDMSKGFKDVYLLWNMVDLLGLDEDKMFSKYLDKGPVRLNVQMKDGSKIRNLQAMCRQKLHPVYSQVILPVLRLADLGYYPESERLLTDHPRIHSLYLTTLLCQTVLPVRVFDDDKLADDQFVAIKKDEAERLQEPWLIGENLAEKSKVSDEIKPILASMDAIVSDDMEEAQASIKIIKANVESRSKMIQKMLKVAVRQIKDKIGSKIGKMLFRREAKTQLELVDGETLASRVDENQALLHEEDDDEGYRVKRSGFLYNAGIVLGYIAWILYIIVLQSIKLVIMFMPPFLFFTLPLTVLGFLLEPEDTARWLTKAWVWGVDVRRLVH